MLHLFWVAFGVGLTFFASPGPINIESVRRGVRDGARPAFLVQLGAILLALGVGGAVLLGLAPVITRADVQRALTLLGGSLLLGMAWRTLRAARRETEVRTEPAAERRSVLMGAFCAASNPLLPMTWLSVASAAATIDHNARWPTILVVSVVGYAIGTLTWAILIASVIGWSRTVVQARYIRWWNVASGVALGAFGIHLLWTNLLRG